MAASTRKPSRTAAGEGRKTTGRPGLKAAGGLEVADRRLQAVRRASTLLKHASDPTRLRIILILAGTEWPSDALCAELLQSHQAVSRHLAILRKAGIIASRRQGRTYFYGLTEAGGELGGLVKRLMTPRPGRSTPGPSRRGEIEQESWDRMNRRRADLIFKKNRGGLDDAERSELDQLQSVSRTQMHREFPAPP